ncbi:MAG: IS200/IS605 family transposase [Acidobacteriota bacterium]|nr:MAG: IS200/IS605 family transposase [Acidobacteriota bacterium]
MPHTYVASYYHCVFSTKRRRKIITEDLEERLFPYLGGIARANEMKLLSVGGMPDHVHLLLSLPPTMPISKAVQLIKGNASHWINQNFRSAGRFEWQAGYGAFTVSVRDLERTRNYIQNQKKHHSKRSFNEEFRAFLERNGLA